KNDFPFGKEFEKPWASSREEREIWMGIDCLPSRLRGFAPKRCSCSGRSVRRTSHLRCSNSFPFGKVVLRTLRKGLRGGLPPLHPVGRSVAPPLPRGAGAVMAIAWETVHYENVAFSTPARHADRCIGSIFSIDLDPVSDLDQGDYHGISFDCEDRSILPNTKRVQGTA
ncbi:MAG: hypothetical protein PWR25_1499, partial [Euryarchaeota archaeon]|nr:hypothetical protein [Euryarchaeota archaeon]